MSNIDKFIQSFDNLNTTKVAKHVMKDIHADITDYNSVIQIENLILDLKPNSQKHITTICYILGLYAKWLKEQNFVQNDNLYQIISSLDKKLIWKKARKTAPKKFISNNQFKVILHEIELYENYNSLYYATLFSCIYNGIYSDNMSVLKNLRRSDIQEDGIVTLREDNSHVYKIKISERFAKDLIQLSNINEWLRPNRFSLCHVEMKGVYSDSVFKVENRSSNSEDSYKFSYYSKLRKISKEYVGYSLMPLQLYASGIMHRIKVELDKNNISLEEAFAKNSRNKTAHMIIEKELVRCNSGIEISNFRELVKGHLDSF